MTFINETSDMWPMSILLFLLAIAIFTAMVAINTSEKYKEAVADLRQCLEAQEEITRRRDSQIVLAEGKAAERLHALNKAQDEIRKLKGERGNLQQQLKAAVRDIESLQAFNGDMHRVIDMDAEQLKEKDRIIAIQNEKIGKLMKIRRK